IVDMSRLAIGYEAAGKLDLALPLHQAAAVGIEKRQFRHEMTSIIMSNTIRTLEQARQFDQAEGWRRKWLAVIKERDGVHVPWDFIDRGMLGANLLRQQKWTEAETVLRECLALPAKGEPDVWHESHTKSLLGAALLGQKKYAEAEPLLLRGYEGM